MIADKQTRLLVLELLGGLFLILIKEISHAILLVLSLSLIHI